MIAQDGMGGKAQRHDHEITTLKKRVKSGKISALEAVIGPIINTLKLNKARRRPDPVTPPEQIDMRSIWSEAQ